MNKIKEFLDTPLSNENNILYILMFILAGITAIAVMFIIIKSLISCVKHSKKYKYKFINIPNIICLSIAIAYIAYKDKIDEFINGKFPNTVIYIILTVLILIPLIRNIINCKLFYGIQYTLWQTFFGLFSISVVYAVICLIIMAAAVFIGISTSTEGSRVWLMSYTKPRISGTLVSDTIVIDDNGNNYYKNGEYFYDDDFNRYWLA